MARSVSEGLLIISGKSFSQTIRIPGAKRVWPTVDDLEVRAQLRVDKFVTSPLISNIHDFMTWFYDGDDLVIEWVMSGAQTREIHALKWGPVKTGYFNLIVSDVGTEDNRALVVPVIKVKTADTTTSAGGSL